MLPRQPHLQSELSSSCHCRFGFNSSAWCRWCHPPRLCWLLTIELTFSPRGLLQLTLTLDELHIMDPVPPPWAKSFRRPQGGSPSLCLHTLTWCVKLSQKPCVIFYSKDATGVCHRKALLHRGPSHLSPAAPHPQGAVMTSAATEHHSIALGTGLQ